MKSMMIGLGAGAAALLTAIGAGTFSAGQATPPQQQQDWSAAESEVPSNPLKDAYFGELHIHTNNSFDSYIFGNPLNPDDAYRFAQGEQVTLYGGATKQLATPLDFVAVTDHAEFLGELNLCTTKTSPTYGTDMCKSMRANNMSSFAALARSVTARKRLETVCGTDGQMCVDVADSLWNQARANANRHYRPGKFTTLIGYEFSANTPTAQFSSPGDKVRADVPGMLHRNVIFRSDTVPSTAFSAYDGTGEDLHSWLEANCTGDCRALAIPHNSNYSWGRFFWKGKNSDGSPWTKEILERRARVEPLVEIFQIKGSSECMAGVGLTDEECGFENAVAACPPGQQDACASASSFVRTAIVRGLEVEREMGVNPFKYGFIAASDTHNGTPGATEENDYKGHLGLQDYTLAKRLGYTDKIGPNGKPVKGPGFNYLMFNPGGLAAVWAEKNTRGSVWDALHRRETYGTSGTRIRVRFFGSFEYPAGLDRQPDFLKRAYALGVPMGEDLRPAREQGASPRFAVWAMRDPQSAPLQKIQIIKGWVEDGVEKSRTIDVVCSDGITPDPRTGQCADNGAAIAEGSCAIAKDKGAAELSATWSDPDFDAGKRAVYYVRVLEIPTCRYSAFDEAALGVPHDEKWPRTIRERAWTSPIWYTPKAN